MSRYQVSAKSESAHCCFEATVLDTESWQWADNAKTVPLLKADGTLYYESVCECFELAHAEMIAAALNARSPL